MSTLHDRLGELADGVAGTVGADATGLWDQGRRWQRRRRAGNVVVVAVTCLLLGALGWQVRERGRTQDAVLPAGSPAGLPDRVWEPSGRLPGTDSVGPPGRIALTMTTDRAGWWGSERGTVAVSAETGRYAFLDLPRQADESTALSPDGRYLAYWHTGTPSGSPPEEGEAVTGFAVYDARTGEVRTQAVETEHGLDAEALVFADDETLVAEFYQHAGGQGDDPEDQATLLEAPLWRWDLRTGEAGEDPALTEVVRGQTLDGGGHGYVWWVGDSGNVHRVVDVHDAVPTAYAVPVRSGSLSYTAAVDRSGERVATISPNRSPSRVVWGSASEEERQIPGSGRTSQVLAWLDSSHVVVLRTPPGEGIVNPGVWLLDVISGEVREIVSPVGEVGANGDVLQPVLDCCGSKDVAWELASESTFEAIKPPNPVDPRAVLGGGLTLVMLAVLALVLWRRRVRP